MTLGLYVCKRLNPCLGAVTRGYRVGKLVHGNYALEPLPGAEAQGPEKAKTASNSSSQLANLINAYRRFGYLRAELDPLGLWRTQASGEALVEELDPLLYGLNLVEDGEKPASGGEVTLRELVAHLNRMYCGPITVEFMHLLNSAERQWFATNYEQLHVHEFSREEKLAAHEVILRTKCWERFLATKFPTLKRYSGEGSEAAAAFHWYLMEQSSLHGIVELIFDGAHRGKLALLTTLFRYPAVQLFRKINGEDEFPPDVQASGDVLTHQISSFDYTNSGGQKMHVSMVPNPSHLEVSLPVALGKARAKAQTLQLGDYAKHGGGRCGDGVLCVHHHGDGAFTGQGVVWESVALSQVPHFRVGGSVHLVVNNQVAFTAERTIGRSSLHCTDIAKGVDSPVIHVNGDQLEGVLLAAKMALAYRQAFRKDVFVNMLCYRRHGHNELDDPSFTQPQMYAAVAKQRSVVDIYGEQLIVENILTKEGVDECSKRYTSELETALKEAEDGRSQPVAEHLRGNWTGYKQAPAATEDWSTGLELDLLRFIGAASVTVPPNFNLHPHLAKTHVEARLRRLRNGEPIDWATAEAMAIGSLLAQGYDVRVSGQDVGRATFSHRHAMLVDQRSDEVYIPLNHLGREQTNFLEMANSPLSEEAVLGFEYGFSSENPRRLVVWEAQFGDFYNAAQVQIDQLVASGEGKWLLLSGIVLMLPHGFDGAGPDHSSAHVERFLQLTNSREDQKPIDGSNVNMVVANPTSSAQYFHLLRRQVLTPYRKPLILVSPKLLLRHPAAMSPLEEFGPETHFHPVVDEQLLAKEGERQPAKVKRLVFASGKHAIHLASEAKQRGVNDMAIIRLECVCPFPAQELADAVSRFPNAQQFIWSQEEPRNAGCWGFVSPRFRNALGIELHYNGRPELAWMATAIGNRHKREAEEILSNLFN